MVLCVEPTRTADKASIEGIKQRNTRLQANVKKLEEQAKKLGEHNDDLNAQLMDLKKYVPSIAVLPTVCLNGLFHVPCCFPM